MSQEEVLRDDVLIWRQINAGMGIDGRWLREDGGTVEKLMINEWLKETSEASVKWKWEERLQISSRERGLTENIGRQ